MAKGLVACPSCQLVCKIPNSGRPADTICPRCGAALHPRIPASLSRTWALIIAAAIFYIPANLLTITNTVRIGKAQSDTIVSGVMYFLRTGSWYIAVIIFTASVIVPLLKLVVLSFLLISIRRRSAWRPDRRTRMFRMLLIIGRWSMVDIFVLTVLVALVRQGFLASVYAGPAALYFGAVVVLTMLATDSFDTRFIWDTLETSF